MSRSHLSVSMATPCLHVVLAPAAHGLAISEDSGDASEALCRAAVRLAVVRVRLLEGFRLPQAAAEGRRERRALAPPELQLRLQGALHELLPRRVEVALAVFEAPEVG